MRRRVIGAIAAMAAACQTDGSSVEVDRRALSSPQGDLPASMSKLRVDGLRFGQVDMEGCHATLIDEAWALTASHCFDDFDPSFGVEVQLFGRTVGAGAVRFHPEARSDGEEEWVGVGDAISPPHDLALVRFDPPLTGHAVSRLWHPANGEDFAQQIDLTGRTLTIGGHGGDWFGASASGAQTVEGMDPYGDSLMIDGNSTPSALQPGDSGGGALLTLDASLGGSVPFFTVPCAIALAAPGEPALVAVNVQGPDYFAPAYLPANADWIAKTTKHDRDGDLVCDEQDNCVDVPNHDQANCNRLAETAPGFGGSGEELGDACDPTPCPDVELEETDQIVVTSSPFPDYVGDVLVFYSWGRVIADLVRLTPVLEVGGAVSSEVTPRFCLCRDGDGKPIDSVDTCAQAPHHCHLDPIETGPGIDEVGGDVTPTASQTFWHLISIDHGPPAGIVKGESFAITYPGAAIDATWAYEQDHADWSAAGWVDAIPFDPAYGPGTDLAGVLWARDETDAGIAEHGVPDGMCLFSGPGDGCSFADGFAYAIAPDARTTFTHARKVPRLKPAPWWSYCAPCGDDWMLLEETVSNPAPFVTIEPRSSIAWQWTGHGAVDVTSRIGAELRRAIADEGNVWIAAEPRVAGAPRAVALSADGTRLTFAVEKGSQAFELVPLDGAEGGRPRRGFAVAWAPGARAAIVAGGVDDAGGEVRELWVHSLATGVTRVPLARGAAPRDALAAAFSQADGQLWVLEQGGRLMRIDVATGALTSDGPLELADGVRSAWLTTLDDGRVLVAAARPETFSLAILAAEGEGVRVDASYEGTGLLATAPDARGDVVSVAIEHQTRSEGWLEPVAIPVTSFR